MGVNASAAMEHLLDDSNPVCPFPGHSSAFVTGVSTSARPSVETAPPSEAPGGQPVDSAEQALVPAPPPTESGIATPIDGLATRFPVELEVAIPVRDFRVRHLLALGNGSVVESQWPHGEDVPLAVGDVQLAWTEFEVMDAKLAVRITRLA